MTPLMITLMVLAGIALLIAIGYLNHVAENGKLEKARTKVELSDRLRRCGEITEVFPGQLMSPALKLLLTRLELNVVQRMLNMEKGNAQLKHRIGELEEQIAKGEGIDVPNPVSPIQTEAKAKDVRFLLEALHGQVTRAAHDGFLQTSEAKHWIREIRTILVNLHIEFFNNLGQTALSQDQPGQARLAFERGVQYLRNQPDPVTYQQQLLAMEKQLARANSVVLTNTAPTEDDDNALTEGLKQDDTESEWKKKVIYD
ncbi:Uncharacterized protein ALO43_02975 [Pseudomonas tremae]|uniref:Uncharacterized protein n=5 Tax=Pseudomonas syringae group TaxID=136849 RepID=A0AB37QVA6_9PSED|nr:hypothetical protein OA77_07625 [Pseudomonas coronafaciens]KOP55458.1 hypothetical protein OX88_14005 [Pseudomonas coronafaciens pv. porri]KPW33528.1 Uncharacterized protein ALO66_00607 [Pseudomonas coronafaciens pv. atropurpurea]KPX33618.1 Uncharacterized protein ALO77_00885 [Pseudomonas coronafaciens pv. garcae]KPY03364.1 Uncharacterized protein ALO57_00449 [Pseudomonas coronafaciens pv. oryzae]KPY90792.1 Uncharacterized protein ALO43_02975 [Pseudomonas tremae]KPZ20990.1 Uncharacterized 